MLTIFDVTKYEPGNHYLSLVAWLGILFWIASQVLQLAPDFAVCYYYQNREEIKFYN